MSSNPPVQPAADEAPQPPQVLNPVPVGLLNQGATCYLNSLVQMLYFTNELRRAVYAMPTTVNGVLPVCAGLQRVFHALQFQNEPVSTVKLTQCFGWLARDSFAQRDVQEFLRRLLLMVEDEMEQTVVAGTVPRLFEGQTSTYVRCTKVAYESSRMERFNDLQLRVKGMRNVAESFGEYTRTETLDGDNKYDAGPHGLQEAEKGVVFVSFPPVLHLHLMRFEFDRIAATSAKCNDRYEFSERMNLRDYMKQPPHGGSPDSDYTLQAVLVHSGGSQGGHYIVFIDPLCNGNWLKFDDHVVTKCTKAEAIEHNYGGAELLATVGGCAYMLVYVRDSARSRLLSEIRSTDVPRELSKRLEKERRVEREQADALTYMSVNIIVEDYLKGQHSIDLFDSEVIQFRPIRVKKSETVGAFVDALAVQFRTKPECLRMWPLLHRPNQPTRLSVFNWAVQKMQTMFMCAAMRNPWPVFLELVRPSAEKPDAILPPFDPNADIFMFFKCYAPEQQRLLFCGYGTYALTSTFHAMVPDLCARAGLPENTELEIYEERAANVAQRVVDQADTLWRVLKVHSRKRRFVDTFITWIWPVDHTTRSIDGIVLVFEKRVDPTSQSSYAAFTASKVADDADDASLTWHDPSTEAAPSSTVRSQAALKGTKMFKCLWHSIDMKEEMQLSLCLKETGTVQTLLQKAAEQVPQNSTDGSGRLRIVEVQDFMVLPGPPEDELLKHLQTGDQKAYRIEEVPRDEANLAEDEMLVPVFRYHTIPATRFGVPFLVLAKQGEMYGVLKERIRRKIGNDQMKVVLVKGTEVDDVADAVEVNLVDFQPTDIAAPVLIGVEHQPHEPECN